MFVNNVKLVTNGRILKFRIGSEIRSIGSGIELKESCDEVECLIIEGNMLKVFFKNNVSQSWYPLNKYYSVTFDEL